MIIGADTPRLLLADQLLDLHGVRPLGGLPGLHADVVLHDHLRGHVVGAGSDDYVRQHTAGPALLGGALAVAGSHWIGIRVAIGGHGVELGIG